MGQKPLQRLKKEVHKFLAQIALAPHIWRERSRAGLLRHLLVLGLGQVLKMVRQFPQVIGGLEFLGQPHVVVRHF